MCLPLPILAGGLAAVGSLTQGVQGMMQGQYESRVARQNAAIENERAHQSIVQGQQEARDFYRSLGAVKGQQEASMAANGIDIGSGTAALIQEDTAQIGKEDADRLYKAQLDRLKGHDYSAVNFETEARAAKFRGRNALVNSGFQAASSLMGGFQQNRALRARVKTGTASSSAWYNPFGH